MGVEDDDDDEDQLNGFAPVDLSAFDWNDEDSEDESAGDLRWSSQSPQAAAVQIRTPRVDEAVPSRQQLYMSPPTKPRLPELNASAVSCQAAELQDDRVRQLGEEWGFKVRTGA